MANLTVRLPAVSWLVRLRLAGVCAVLAVLTFLAFCLGVGLGDIPIGLTEVVTALFGRGEQGQLFVIWQLRLPRALVGLLAGAAFGLSGALFQTMTRNPLASPDMIGAVAAALLTYLLAWRRGITGYRVVLVGIGLPWVFTSATEYLMVISEKFQAQAALGWLFGNLNGRTWDHVTPPAFAPAVLGPVALLLGRWSRALQLGEDVATVLGTPVQRARVALLAAGVALVAFGTAAAGPIAFVALAAPQLAQRLAGTAWPPPLTAALTGGFLVLAADLLARRAVPGLELPVGVVTGVLGAPLLLWLLARARRP
ncbi:FecCD family ABC transporter permease [Nonomuraea typhae]|uniref:FecCD family ABC transporter permease n=1 Tax=Nonomuraea typhae TaxID=2603600 RepID=A0ABW7YR70_9ACTN